MTRNPVENCIMMVLFLFGISQLQAQPLLPAQDSIQPQPVAKRVLPIKPTTDFDQRFYYMQNRMANVWGYRVGILVHDKYKIGIGGYYMNEGIANPNTAANLALSRTSGSEQYRQQLYLGTVYYEPLFTNIVATSGSPAWWWLKQATGRSVNSLTQDLATKIISGKQNKAFIPAGIGLSVNLKMPPLFGFLPHPLAGHQCHRRLPEGAVLRTETPITTTARYWSISGAIFLDRGHRRPALLET